MPRYFFNIYDHTREQDDEGVELSGPAEARVQAVIFAGDFLSDNPTLLEGADLAIEVRNEANAILLTVRMTSEEPGVRR